MLLPMQARFLIPRDGIVAKSEVMFDREAGTRPAPDLELDGRGRWNENDNEQAFLKLSGGR